MTSPAILGNLRAVDPSRTTADVQQYLKELADLRGDLPAEPVVRALLARAVDRLHLLCSMLLRRHYPRLTRGPLNLDTQELLGGVVERLIKAMRQVRPQTVQQFFALSTQHMRWELNDLARRLDQREPHVELTEAVAGVPPTDPASTSSNVRLSRILAVIEALPADVREAFDLVRIQGMTQPEAAGVIRCSVKTVQRRLNRGLLLLEEQLADALPDRPGGPGDR